MRYADYQRSKSSFPALLAGRSLVHFSGMTDCMSLKVASNVNIYVGENQKRFVIPVSFLNHPSFQDLLGMSQEEFGYSHPTGGLTIPCNEDTFLKVTSRMY
ncbi:hypothetical protein Godav_014574 [Gossypium davidsonii]|uniref:Uncharacterized protein n=1 Tax=Gossypium davidsonii TaxID=34287 RepID=A0A7J8RK98_GOSDV|nr:hypothetical protein [Gossypium davidsonii]